MKYYNIIYDCTMKYIVKVELTTLLTAIGAIALKEKCLKIASCAKITPAIGA